MRVRWLLRAVGDLEQLYTYIAEASPEAADREAEGLLRAVKRIGRFPGSGRPGRVPGTRELVISRFIVAYRVKENMVQVLRVLHAARKWPSRM